ncbi:MAG: conjugative transposon protein TraM [Prolixibacteraceae bacterium]|nr:conjugative transposon protein TraM [Prolixibacteraceae bacterium]
MEKQEKTQKMIRQGRFMLMLPLLTLPFLTLMFWALGGGKAEEAEALDAAPRAGINVNLPGASLKDRKAMDKMSYYNQARQDSARLRELKKSDPNYKAERLHENGTTPFQPQSSSQGNPGRQGINSSLYGNDNSDPNQERIYRKLAELEREMNKPVTQEALPVTEDDTGRKITGEGTFPVNTADVDRLEQMMQMISQPGEPDPEIQQLNGMLEKILDIQHPDRVQEKLRHVSEARRGEVFAVSTRTGDDTVTLLDNGQATGNQASGFYSLEEAIPEDTQNAIRAVIHETRTVVNGSTVKLRLVNDVLINGVRIPKDNFLFGTASLSGERLSVRINSIRYNNSLFPVELSVYDMDGLSGIYIPGAITRDVAKQSADRSLQTLGMTTLDGSLEAQMASAGIETAKTLLSKKVRLIKVVVKAGYQVLLRDEKQKQNMTN